MTRSSTYHVFVLLAILYFFLNNVLLPQGLLFTAILSPIFIYWLYKTNHLKKMIWWSWILIIPIPFHIITGFDISSYVVSSFLVLTVWIFLFAAIEWMKAMNKQMDQVFFKILIINSLLLFIAILALTIPLTRQLFWDETPISPGIPGFPRLKMLAYEPSHYALLLSPVFIFYTLKIITGKIRHQLIYIAGIAIPLLLSLSFGVIGAMSLAVVITLLIYWKRLKRLTKSYLFYGLFLGISLIILVAVLWPDNPVFLRIGNILSGSDTSAKGRLHNSFMFAIDLIRNHQAWFGVGPGQVKILAHDLIINYYQYSGDYAEVVRIPNSMGEMLAVYGVYGFLLKLFFEIYFFIRLKVYQDIFSLSLFIFIFIYQFTGSFLVNVAEIGIWAIVYNCRFSFFHKDQLLESQS